MATRYEVISVAGDSYFPTEADAIAFALRLSSGAVERAYISANYGPWIARAERGTLYRKTGTDTWTPV